MKRRLRVQGPDRYRVLDFFAQFFQGCLGLQSLILERAFLDPSCIPYGLVEPLYLNPTPPKP